MRIMSKGVSHKAVSTVSMINSEYVPKTVPFGVCSKIQLYLEQSYCY